MKGEVASAVEEASDRAVRERCIKQLVQTAVRRPKYPLCRQATDQYTARNAIRNINRRDTEDVNFLFAKKSKIRR